MQACPASGPAGAPGRQRAGIAVPSKQGTTAPGARPNKALAVVAVVLGAGVGRGAPCVRLGVGLEHEPGAGGATQAPSSLQAPCCSGTLHAMLPPTAPLPQGERGADAGGVWMVIRLCDVGVTSNCPISMSATSEPAPTLTSRAGRGAEWLRALGRESTSSSLLTTPRSRPATAPSAWGALVVACGLHRSMMTTVMLSWLPACMAALISKWVATRSAASRLTPRDSARAMHVRAMRAASSLLSPPHSPSLASSRNSS